MHWPLESYLLGRPLQPGRDQALIDANWELGAAKCWAQVFGKTFWEFGIANIQTAGQDW